MSKMINVLFSAWSLFAGNAIAGPNFDILKQTDYSCVFTNQGKAFTGTLTTAFVEYRYSKERQYIVRVELDRGFQDIMTKHYGRSNFDQRAPWSVTLKRQSVRAGGNEPALRSEVFEVRGQWIDYFAGGPADVAQQYTLKRIDPKHFDLRIVQVKFLLGAEDQTLIFPGTCRIALE